MFRQTLAEQQREEDNLRRENMEFLERLHKKGAGCFGVRRGSKEIKKELDKLRKKR